MSTEITGNCHPTHYVYIPADFLSSACVLAYNSRKNFEQHHIYGTLNLPKCKRTPPYFRSRLGNAHTDFEVGFKFLTLTPHPMRSQLKEYYQVIPLFVVKETNLLECN